MRCGIYPKGGYGGPTRRAATARSSSAITVSSAAVFVGRKEAAAQRIAQTAMLNNAATIRPKVCMTKAIIVGAGMGGLAAALALHQQGAEVEVYEQAQALREVGAGLTLSSGALKCLHGLGVLDDVRRVSSVSARMPFLHYRTAQLLWGEFDTAQAQAAQPLDDPFVSRHIFRADLQNLLAAQLQARHPGAVHLAHALTAVDQDGAGVTATFANGQSARGDMLIGADGLHSVVRAAICGASPPSFTGQVAWRFLADGQRAQPFMSSGRASVFFGPDRVFNRYPLRGGDLLNCVAIVRTPGWRGEGWSTPGDPLELADLFKGWHADVRALMSLAEPGRLVKWALAARPALPTWQDRRVALLGDAAHPMLPFLGLGAAMAIEDAAILGRAVALEAAPQAALARYEAARRPRATAVAQASVQQGLALQARDPDRFIVAQAPVATRELFDYEPATVPM